MMSDINGSRKMILRRTVMINKHLSMAVHYRNLQNKLEKVKIHKSGAPLAFLSVCQVLDIGQFLKPFPLVEVSLYKMSVYGRP